MTVHPLACAGARADQKPGQLSKRRVRLWASWPYRAGNLSDFMFTGDRRGRPTHGYTQPVEYGARGNGMTSGSRIHIQWTHTFFVWPSLLAAALSCVLVGFRPAALEPRAGALPWTDARRCALQQRFVRRFRPDARGPSRSAFTRSRRSRSRLRNQRGRRRLPRRDRRSANSGESLAQRRHRQLGLDLAEALTKSDRHGRLLASPRRGHTEREGQPGRLRARRRR